ncbi:MFS transporter [Pseudarthrobacter phenanthrenivorans]|uniref:MFS transporter n=1 Tax=Pseudarthrobacter phenanthrenivorans TaxID=361575 RepID=UPI002F34F16B
MADTPAARAVAEPIARHRWAALVFISLAQLIVVFDASIMNIALPQAQADLGFNNADRQWVITAYSLAFGALLLLGGRIADRWGRSRAFSIGLIGFGMASVLGGLAANIELLLAARVLQGAFAALLAPAALSLLSATFTIGSERAKAFGVFSAVAGAGGGIGMLLGGALTEYASWRWTLLVNTVFAAIALAGAVRYIQETGDKRKHERLDLPGIMLASAGLASLVLGFSRAETSGWGHGSTIASLVAATVLLAAFLMVEHRAASPLLPLHVLADRNRGAAFLSGALASAVLFTQFLFLSYYMQSLLGFSPLLCGLAFLPVVACLIIGSSYVGPPLFRCIPTRALMGTGYLLSAAGLLMLTGLTTDNAYVALVLPAGVLIGIGSGTAFFCSMVLATDGVPMKDIGVASAVVNTSQQVGGAVGTALMSSIAAVAASSSGQATRPAAVHGYATAFLWASGLLLLAAIIAFTVTRRQGPSNLPNDAPTEPQEERLTTNITASK